jgi:hypothetical protein
MSTYFCLELEGHVTKLRVALIHYWLVGMRGGERVLERIARLYPDADIFTHVYDPQAVSPELRARNVRTSFIARHGCTKAICR